MKIKTVTKIPFNDSDLLVVYEDDSGNEIQETNSVPIDTNNTDYAQVLHWVEDGGKISDAPVLKTD
jgi:hypothetical protein